MSGRRPKFVFTASRRGVRFTLKAANGEAVCPPSQYYRDETDAKRGACDMAMAAVIAMAALVKPDGT